MSYPDMMIKTGRDYDPRRRREPPRPVHRHGVAFGVKGACLVSARWMDGQRTGVYGFETYAPSLTAVGARIVELLDSDPTCRVVVDAGLHGRDLVEYLGHRSRLDLFEIERPELRRAELGGKLRAANERGEFAIKRLGAGAIALRAALADAAREDAADRVEVVALSLAIKNHRRVPRIG